MSDMQAFYKMLTDTTNRSDRHLDALTAITEANRDQLRALASDLVWQTWGAPTVAA